MRPFEQIRHAIMAEFQREILAAQKQQGFQSESLALEKALDRTEDRLFRLSYAVGICPNNLNGNHQAWCSQVEWFPTRKQRDDRAMELYVQLHDTCNTTHCWEEEEILPPSNSYTRTTPRVR